MILIETFPASSEEIKQVVTEIINGEQESYTVGAEAYSLKTSAIRAKINGLLQKIRELTMKASDAVGTQRDKFGSQLREVRDELALALKDLRNAVREIMGMEPLTYSFENDLDDHYIVDTVKGLRQKLNEKLEQVKGYVEMIKVAHGLLKEQLRAGLETAKEQIKDLKEQILQKVKEELNKPVEE